MLLTEHLFLLLWENFQIMHYFIDKGRKIPTTSSSACRSVSQGMAIFAHTMCSPSAKGKRGVKLQMLHKDRMRLFKKTGGRIWSRGWRILDKKYPTIRVSFAPIESACYPRITAVWHPKPSQGESLAHRAAWDKAQSTDKKRRLARNTDWKNEKSGWSECVSREEKKERGKWEQHGIGLCKSEWGSWAQSNRVFPKSISGLKASVRVGI